MRLKTIKSRETFNALRQSGKSVKTDSFRIVFLEGLEFQVGFAMPRALGTAVRRNKLRRRMTEAIKELYKTPLKSGAYLFKPSKKAMEMSYVDMYGALDKLFRESKFYLSNSCQMLDSENAKSK